MFFFKFYYFIKTLNLKYMDVEIEIKTTTRKSISSLASEVIEELKSQRTLLNEVNIFDYWNNYIKDVMSRILLEKEIKNEKIKIEFFYYLENLRENIKEHQNFILDLKNKINELNKNIKDMNSNQENEEYKKNNFLLNNILLFKDNYIKVIKRQIKGFKKGNFEFFYKPEQIFGYYSFQLNIYQNKLLLKCRNYNKLLLQINEKKNNIEELKQEINNIELGKNINSNQKYIIEKKKSKESMINEEFNFEESKTDILIDDDIHSDDEIELEKKINLNNQSLLFYSEDLKKKIPYLNLKQIDYNKKKPPKEIDIYSLERRNKDEDIDEKIKYYKKEINKIKKKIQLNHDKIQSFEKVFELMKNDIKVLEQKNFKNNNSEDKEEIID